MLEFFSPGNFRAKKIPAIWIFESEKPMDFIKKSTGAISCYKRGQDASDKDRTKCPSPANTDLRHFEITHMGQMCNICTE